MNVDDYLFMLPGEYFLNPLGELCRKEDNNNMALYADGHWNNHLAYINHHPRFGYKQTITNDEANVMLTKIGETYMTILNTDKLPENLAQGYKQVQANYIEYALQKCRYNQTKTAAKLGISRNTLRTKLKTFFGDKYIK